MKLKVIKEALTSSIHKTDVEYYFGYKGTDWSNESYFGGDYFLIFESEKYEGKYEIECTLDVSFPSEYYDSIDDAYAEAVEAVYPEDGSELVISTSKHELEYLNDAEDDSEIEEGTSISEDYGTLSNPFEDARDILSKALDKCSEVVASSEVSPGRFEVLTAYDTYVFDVVGHIPEEGGRLMPFKRVTESSDFESSGRKSDYDSLIAQGYSPEEAWAEIDSYSYDEGDDYMTESIDPGTLEPKLKSALREIMTSTEFGFDNSEVDNYCSISVSGNEVEIRAEVDYDALMAIANKLNPIIQKYNKEAYFDARVVPEYWLLCCNLC